MILVDLDSVSTQWVGQETLPSVTYIYIYVKGQYFCTNLCISYR
jgi:hypothetical protein